MFKIEIIWFTHLYFFWILVLFGLKTCTFWWICSIDFLNTCTFGWCFGCCHIYAVRKRKKTASEPGVVKPIDGCWLKVANRRPIYAVSAWSFQFWWDESVLWGQVCSQIQVHQEKYARFSIIFDKSLWCGRVFWQIGTSLWWKRSRVSNGNYAKQGLSAQSHQINAAATRIWAKHRRL